jgi:uncharacterized delta-60 repeat protein
MRKIIYTCSLIIFTNCVLKAQPGSLDLTFNPGTGFDQPPLAILIQQDGKVIAGGEFSSYNGVAKQNLVRLNVDGSIDTTFIPARRIASQTDMVNSLTLQNDGKIIVGTFSEDSIFRLNSDGSMDNSFQHPSGLNFYNGVYTLAVQSDGKILAGDNGMNLLRFDSMGNVDLNFSVTPNSHFGGGYFSIALQANGKIMCDAANGLIKLNIDGSIDSSFIIPSNININGEGMVAVESNGKIIAGGNLPSYNEIVRLDSNGIIDPSFNGSSILNNTVSTFAIDSNNKIIVGGAFTNYVARLNSDGSIDNTFNTGTGFTISGSGGSVYAVAIQQDGKIMTAGNFTSYNGVSRHYIARLNGDNSTGIASINTSGSIIVYPNPSSGRFYFNSAKNGSGIEIYNLIGQKIFSSVVTSDNYSINIAGQENGVYFYKVSDQNNLIQQGKIVIE